MKVLEKERIMCGLVGFTNREKRIAHPEQVIRYMLDSIKYRGPNQDGYYIDGDISAGVCRLSILDISKAACQPIYNENKTIWAMHNGEIYNFVELKNLLEKKGHVFTTKSDSEVIVHAYEEFGVDCVEKLNGMFAFALWDKSIKTLLLARDRFGIKPLYYYEHENEIIFASEPKAILCFPNFSKELDLVSLDRYLTLEYVPSPRSIFKGIKKIPSATYLSFTEGKANIRTYWQPEFVNEPFTKSPSLGVLKEKLRFLVESSIKRQLISDVPIGIFLSGGIDSSVLTAFAHKDIPHIETFSVGFNEKSFDETKHSRKVAEIFNTRHNHYTFDLGALNNIFSEAINVLDEPLGDASFFPTFFLARQARQKVVVALSGEGGDEIFGGYPTYLAHRFADLYQRIPGVIKNKVVSRIINALPVSLDNLSLDFVAKRFIQWAHLSLLARHYSWMGSFSPDEKKYLYSRYLQEMLKTQESRDAATASLDSFVRGSDSINRLLYLDMMTYLQDDLLVKADRASAANAMEIRVPYLDNELVQFMLTVPSRYKVTRFNTKYLFKQGFRDILPSQIINRPKKGFGIPLGYWINDGFREQILERLCGKQIQREGLFNKDYVDTLVKQHLTRKVDNRKKIWTLFMFQAWKEKWM